MTDKPHIPLSELRKLWKSAVGDWMNFAPRAEDLFRSRVHDEVQRRRIKELEAELAQLRAQLAECEQWEMVENGAYNTFPLNPSYRLIVNHGVLVSFWKDAEHKQNMHIGGFRLFRHKSDDTRKEGDDER